MSKSTLTGTTWYWREGQLRFPIGSDFQGIKSKELCLPISDNILIDPIRTELENHHIEVHAKKIHRDFMNYPAGTKILYAYSPLSTIEELSTYQKNLKMLQAYIIENGGQIYDKENPQNKGKISKIALKSILKWFGRE